MNGRVQKVVISGMTPSCRPVVGSVLLTSVLSSALIHRYIIWIIGQSLHKFSDNRKLRSVTDTPDNHAVNRGTWTGWSNGLARTSRSSTRRNPKSCTWEGRNLGTNTVHQGHQLESSLAEKDLKVLVDTKSVYSAKLVAVVFNHRTRGNGKKMETREIMSEHQETLCVGD